MYTPIFTVTGKILSGSRRGKELGFPTINMQLTEKIPEGIYISQTKLQDKIYNSITFVGAAKTFNESQSRVETFIFNFSQDVYNSISTVFLINKIRENIRYSTAQELVDQMNKDKNAALEFFDLNEG